MASLASRLPVDLDVAPMEAKPVADLPDGPGWQFEPKWDGFRCLAFKAGEEVELKGQVGQVAGPVFSRHGVGAAEPSPRPLVPSTANWSSSSDGCAVLRCAADAPAPCREPHPRSCRRDAGTAHLVRLPDDAMARQPAGTCRSRSAASALEGFVEDAGDAGRAPRRRSPRDLGQAQEVARDRPCGDSTASSPSGSTCPTSPASAPCSRSRTSAPPTAWSAAFATSRRAGRSARCCSASTTLTASSTTSASPPPSADAERPALTEASRGACRAARLHR